MIDEFNSKSNSEYEKIDNFEFGFDDDNLTEKEINRMCKEQSENEYFEEHTYKHILSNGIIEVKYGNEVYKTWTLKLGYPIIKKFIKEICIDSLIIQELNDIDFTIINKKYQIPVEIQKVPIGEGCKFGHTEFENSIRKQLDDVTENYGICWFFFDSEYLRYLQSKNIGNCISVNLTWLVELMKENKLKVFSVRYDGIIKELTTKDFDFLKQISNTCPLGYNNDERVLNRNKLKIYTNVTFGNYFKQEEIDDFYTIYENRSNKNIKKSAARFFTESNDKRCKLYGHILMSIGNLPSINNILNMNANKSNIDNNRYSIDLEIFNKIGNSNIIKFVDKFNICQYFPGYIRNKEQWNSYRNTNLNHETFKMIANGSLKQNRTMTDFMK